MSVKTMAQVWDLDLPQNEKFVLLAYADHADHDGRNIFPAVATIAKKTGYSKRSIQGITRSLEEKGYLIPDGKGPKGTNKWRFQGVQNLHPEKSAGAQSGTRGVQSTTQRGEIATAPEPSLTVKEPSLTQITEKANKTVNAVLEFARLAEEKHKTGEAWPHREKCPDAVRELMDVYVRLTGQRPAKKDVIDWLSTGQDWLDIGITRLDLERAYQKSKPDEKGFGGFTVARPGSLTRTAGMYAGERRTNGNNGGSAIDRVIARLEQQVT